MKKEIIIFSDGSSKGNPGPGGWGAIVLSGGIVTEIGGREEHTTNNRMELLGVISALELVKNSKNEIFVNTDSSYVINGITKWVHGWQKNNWKTKTKEDVLNKDLWKWLLIAISDKKITWRYVGGHIGVPGNERCDVIATANADGVNIELFHGKYDRYELDLTDTIGNKTKKKSKSNSKLPAYSYLSLVNGVFHKDSTWAACEKRVKGIKGNVKFKKSISADDEKEIMKEWGIK
jgi:ribonuclease HI